MSVSKREKRLLSTFPRPPQELAVPSPTEVKVQTPKLSPQYRASDFGFIPVGLSREDGDSLYDDPRDSVYSQATVAPIPVSIQPPSPPNLGQLQLVLDNPSKLYAPLEAITGYVSGWDSSSHIHLVLEGRAKTYFRTEHAEYKDRAPLVYQVTHLKPEDQSVVPRFSVAIPDKTQSGLEKLDEIAPKDHSTFFHRYWTHDWLAQGPFACQPNHPLPPSMIMPRSTSLDLLSRVSAQGYIAYKLVAIRSRLDATTQKLVPEASCQIPVWITTRRLPFSKIEQLTEQTVTQTEKLEVHTRQLTQQRRASLYDNVRDSFSSNTPAFFFTSNISVPKVVTPGSEARISVSISILPPPAGRLYNFGIPDIALLSFSIRVRSYSGLRILRQSITNPDKTLSESRTFKYVELDQSRRKFDAVFRPKNGAFDGQSCVITIKLPKTILPSFATYNFWRSYRLECNITFGVAGKEISLSSQNDLNIVARPGAEVLEGGMKNGMDDEDEATSLEMAKAMVSAIGTGLETALVIVDIVSALGG